MAEFKIPKYKYKGDPISLDECYRELANMSYQSPVSIMYQGVQTKIEGDILEAIHSYGIDVDKDELIKALQYDRNQYEKGFIDGCMNNVDTIRAEFAREIFEEIEKCTVRKVRMNGELLFDSTERFAELKKKYTKGENNP